MVRIVVISFSEFGSVVEFCLHPMVDALALIIVRAYRCTNSDEQKREEDLRRNVPRLSCSERKLRTRADRG